jgi:hypothetical protein
MLSFDNQKATTRGVPAHSSSHSLSGLREQVGKLIRKPIDKE